MPKSTRILDPNIRLFHTQRSGKSYQRVEKDHVQSRCVNQVSVQKKKRHRKLQKGLGEASQDAREG